MHFLYSGPEDLKRIVDYLTTLESPHSVVIRKPNRSLDQNDKWHATLDEMAKSSGYTQEEMKNIIKQSITNSGLLTMVEVKTTKTGMEYTMPRSSAKLKTNEMSILIQYTLDMQEAQLSQLRNTANEIFN